MAQMAEMMKNMQSGGAGAQSGEGPEELD